MRKPLAWSCAIVGAVMLASCGKNVNVEETKAELVPGTNNLYRFCDVANLIYFSKLSGEPDEYEFFLAGGCEPPVSAKPVPTVVPTTGGGR